MEFKEGDSALFVLTNWGYNRDNPVKDSRYKRESVTNCKILEVLDRSYRIALYDDKWQPIMQLGKCRTRIAEFRLVRSLDYRDKVPSP